ncbi:MAG TPA: zinc ABC transporter permease AztB [Actinomycetes bacterium]|nr:zinc ABC transporter permease AztB [Actinomycetes bacterium]
MDWLVEPFSHRFMLEALIAGILAVVTTSLVGTWVVIRGLSFMGDALAHGVLPGIALAFILGFDLTLGAIAGALVMVAGINLVHRTARLREDTGIGLLFVGMLGLGVIIVSRLPSFTGSLTTFLFGDILGIRPHDLVLEAAAAAITLVGVVVLYRPLLVVSFNEAKAQLLCLYPRLAHTAMLVLLTVAIVASFRVVGTLLVFGLLVAPPATASLVARRVPTMMATAVVLGGVSVVAGLLISWHAATAAGATVAAVSVALFFLVLLGRGLIARRPAILDR